MRRNLRILGAAVAGLVLTGAAAFLGCAREPGPATVQEREASPSNPLYVEPASRDFSRNPELLDKLRRNPHRYFRFINIPFSQEVCRRYADLIEGTPVFNLHGDAHIEQYAVTDLGRGLTDFDDSSSGPAILDLLRFGASLHLACAGQDCGDLDAVFGEVLRGYREALQDPSFEAPEPAVAKRLRAGFEYDRQAYFEWVASVMRPIAENDARALEEAMAPYVVAMLDQNPELDSSFYEIVEAGALDLGVGSALDRKYLVRVRGATDEPLDDAVLELKQVRALDEIDCIRVSPGSNPFRVLLGQTRIAYEPFGHLGHARIGGDSFWIHAWVENYEEVEVGESLASADELAEVAFDVGVQLGRGHVNQIGAPLDAQLRAEQLKNLDRDEPRLRTAVRELAELALEAWEDFRVAPPSLP